MTKHADSLNFFQALKDRQTQQRNAQLSPAWWANALSPEVIAAGNIPIVASLFGNKSPNIHTKDEGALSDLIGQSGMDVKPVHQELESWMKKVPGLQPIFRNYFYKAKGHGDITPGAHGIVGQIGGDVDHWNIPMTAHELGHAQIEHGMVGPLARALQKARPLGLLGLGGNIFESYRALGNADRSMDERKRMLNRASAFSGLGSIPMVANEYQASRRGLDLLKGMALENKGEILNAARKAYPKAFSTYALMAAAPVLAPQIAKLFLPKHVS